MCHCTLHTFEEIREEFDPHSGFQYEGRGHYPQCLVTTAYDVFRRLPVARSVVTIHGSEREQAQALLPSIPSRSVLLFDRGYPSYELISYLRKHHQRGYFLFRCPAESTFPAVEAFVRGGQREDYVAIAPSNKYVQGLTARQRKRAMGIQLRMIRLVSPYGTVSVLLTNMTLAAEAAILVPNDPERGAEAFSEILEAIARVKYYRPKAPRPTQPRVTKRPPNKWCSGRRRKLENA